MQQITMNEKILLKGADRINIPQTEDASETVLLRFLGAVFFVPPILLVTLVAIALS